MNVFYKVEHPSEEEDKQAQQSPMETFTLILPLDVTTVNNTSDSSGVTERAIAGATEVVTVGVLIE